MPWVKRSIYVGYYLEQWGGAFAPMEHLHRWHAYTARFHLCATCCLQLSGCTTSMLYVDKVEALSINGSRINITYMNGESTLVKALVSQDSVVWVLVHSQSIWHVFPWCVHDIAAAYKVLAHKTALCPLQRCLHLPQDPTCPHPLRSCPRKPSPPQAPTASPQASWQLPLQCRWALWCSLRWLACWCGWGCSSAGPGT